MISSSLLREAAKRLFGAALFTLTVHDKLKFLSDNYTCNLLVYEDRALNPFN